jgi:two-component system response regulator FixJ
MAETTVHVIDDDLAMRESLDFLLSIQGFKVLLYDSAVAFLAATGPSDGDCILSDVSMPEMSGLELVHKLRDDQVSAPVILMTGQGDIPLAVEAMKAGAADFIEKPFSDDLLMGAVRNALARRNAHPGNEKNDAKERLSQLSPRERDVLVGVVAGKANKVIAYELGISPRTVEIYRANLMTKARARNLSELMRIALAAGL